jgi:hypothetical protein
LKSRKINFFPGHFLSGVPPHRRGAWRRKGGAREGKILTEAHENEKIGVDSEKGKGL